MREFAFAEKKRISIFMEVGILEGEYSWDGPDFPNQIVSHRHFKTILDMKGYDATYREYLPQKLRTAYDEWQAAYEAEMEARTGTFYDQEAEDARNKDQSVLRAIEGEWDPVIRLEQLEADGIVGEVIFPQQAPFGGGLLQYRTPVDPAQNLEGQRAYNRWLADLHQSQARSSPYIFVFIFERCHQRNNCVRCRCVKSSQEEGRVLSDK